MTQPAKVQEPSMEEILASIRRIIADDEAKPADAKPSEVKPAAAETPASSPAPVKPEPPAAKAPVMKDVPPPAIAAKASEVKPAAVAPKPAPPPVAPPAPAPAVSNSQDDIDALLNGLDEATVPEEIRPPLPDGDVVQIGRASCRERV